MNFEQESKRLMIVGTIITKKVSGPGWLPFECIPHIAYLTVCSRQLDAIAREKIHLFQFSFFPTENICNMMSVTQLHNVEWQPRKNSKTEE